MESTEDTALTARISGALDALPPLISVPWRQRFLD
jgi:hypothetical protein